MMTQARNIAVSNLNNILYQMENTGTLQAIQYEDLAKFKLESECKVLDAYQMVLRHEDKTITVFIRSLSQPDGVIQVEIS